MGRLEGLAGFAQQLGDVAPGNPDAHDVLEKVPNPTVGGVAAALEVSGQAGEARPELASLEQVPGQGRLMITAAVMAPNALGRVLKNPEGFLDQLDLLEDALMFLPLRRDDAVGGIDRAVPQAVGDPLIDLTGSKRGPLVLGMSLLAAVPSPRLLLPALALRFDDVTGGRSGQMCESFRAADNWDTKRAFSASSSATRAWSWALCSRSRAISRSWACWRSLPENHPMPTPCE